MAHEEYQYLNLVDEILTRGDSRSDRVSVSLGSLEKTKCIFGAQMKFNLRETFPLLTTKKVYWRGVVEELLWFLRGSTNANELSAKGVKIWNANANVDGELGPIYGYQWRNFGGDQIAQIVETLKTDPFSRRIILTAWNPIDIPKMALPPCHCLAQFDVNSKNELSCQMYQRSADMGLGVPFNIASYALLTHILCHAASTSENKFLPGDFIHTLGNAHVYSAHTEALKTQLTRNPRPFPTLKIITSNRKFEKYTFKDFAIENYDPYPGLEMEMFV
jgi:thymidylate synthase